MYRSETTAMGFFAEPRPTNPLSPAEVPTITVATIPDAILGHAFPTYPGAVNLSMQIEFYLDERGCKESCQGE
jgi:hypothetical protein